MKWVGLGLVFWVIAALYRYVYYHRKLRFIKTYEHAFNQFWESAKDKRAPYADALHEGQTTVQSLLAEVGLLDRGVTVTQEVGYGYIQQGQARPFVNPTTNIHDVVIMHAHTLKSAKGAFRTKRNQSLDPMYWIELVWSAPRYLVPVIDKTPTFIQNAVKLMWAGVLLFTAWKSGTVADLMSALEKIAGK